MAQTSRLLVRLESSAFRATSRLECSSCLLLVCLEANLPECPWFLALLSCVK
jgi:hypothetical protein